MVDFYVKGKIEMNAMEKMLSSVIGMTPEEMQAYVKSAIELLKNLDGRLERIEKAVGIETEKGTENDNSENT